MIRRRRRGRGIAATSGWSPPPRQRVERDETRHRFFRNRHKRGGADSPCKWCGKRRDDPIHYAKAPQ